MHKINITFIKNEIDKIIKHLSENDKLNKLLTEKAGLLSYNELLKENYIIKTPIVDEREIKDNTISIFLKSAEVVDNYNAECYVAICCSSKPRFTNTITSLELAEEVIKTLDKNLYNTASCNYSLLSDGRPGYIILVKFII